MENNDKNVVNFLVLAAGFSKGNALETIRMYQEGELTETEKEVITKIQLRPRNDALGEIHARVLGHLNFRISEAGGQPVTIGKRSFRRNRGVIW